MPFLPNIRNTSTFWMIRRILRDLYDWDEPITTGNWRRLDDMVRERAQDRAWSHSILDRLKIVRTVTEIARRKTGADDDRLQYSLEWGFFTRTQWGEYDTALYELERCWGKQPANRILFRCLLRRMDLWKSGYGPQAAGPGPGREARARSIYA